MSAAALDIGGCLPQVRRIARQVRAGLPSSVELDDLVQAGMLGLVTAARRFDASAGRPFMAFAVHRARGAMLDELRACDWLTRAERERLRLVEQAHQRLTAQHGRAPTDAAIAAELGLSADEVRQARRQADAGPPTSLQALGEEAPELFEHVEQPGANPAEVLEGRQQQRALSRGYQQLPDRERRVLDLLYRQGLTGRAVAAELGVSPQLVSLIARTATARLRQGLIDAGWIAPGASQEGGAA